MLLRMLAEAAEGDCLHHLPKISERDINARTADGATALHFAAAVGYVDVCFELMESPVYMQVNDQDASGCTALHYAACKGHEEVCHVLLQHWRFSAQDAQDWNGWTALHAAAAHGKSTACAALLDSPRFKAMTARDKNGMTAQLVLLHLFYSFVSERAAWPLHPRTLSCFCAMLAGCIWQLVAGAGMFAQHCPHMLRLLEWLSWTTLVEQSMRCETSPSSRTEASRPYKFHLAFPRSPPLRRQSLCQRNG